MGKLRILFCKIPGLDQEAAKPPKGEEVASNDQEIKMPYQKLNSFAEVKLLIHLAQVPDQKDLMSIP